MTMPDLLFTKSPSTSAMPGNASSNPPPSIDTVAAALVAMLGEAQVVRDPDRLAAHAGDWSEAPRHAPALVVYPKTPQEVARIGISTA